MQKARAVLLEALLITVGGVGVGLLANEISPLGLRLTRNYFPGNPAPAVTPQAGATNGVDALAVTLARLQARGLQIARSNEVVEWFRDPLYQQGVYVFVDARDDQHYQAGHVPGAWQFNHYRPEQYLPIVLPVCLAAQKVVVYCSGGACEDSEFAAISLRDAGVPAPVLYVYPGGIAEWTNAWPAEVGPRGSGQLITPTP